MQVFLAPLEAVSHIFHQIIREAAFVGGVSALDVADVAHVEDHVRVAYFSMVLGEEHLGVEVGA